MKLSLVSFAALCSIAAASITEDQALLDTIEPAQYDITDPEPLAFLDILLQAADDVKATLSPGLDDQEIVVDFEFIIDYGNSPDPGTIPLALKLQQDFGFIQWKLLCGPQQWFDLITMDYPESIKEAYDWFIRYGPYYDVARTMNMYEITVQNVYLMWIAQNAAYALEQRDGSEFVFWPPEYSASCVSPYPGDIAATPETSFPTEPLSTKTSADVTSSSIEALPTTTLAIVPTSDSSFIEVIPAKTSEAATTPDFSSTGFPLTDISEDDTAPAATSTEPPPTILSDELPLPTSHTPPSANQLSHLNDIVPPLRDTLNSVLAELPNLPTLRDIVLGISALIDTVMSHLALLLSLAKQDTASDLIDDVINLLQQLRDVDTIVEPVENKSDVLQTNLDSLLNTIAELDAWLEDVERDEQSSSESATVAPASESSPEPVSVPTAVPDSDSISGSNTSSDSEPAAESSPDEPVSSSDSDSDAVPDSESAPSDFVSAPVTNSVSAPVPASSGSTPTPSTTITTIQTVSYCEHDTCGRTVVTLTTCVPVTHTVTTCPTVIEGKTMTVVVPHEIETEHVHVEATVVKSVETLAIARADKAVPNETKAAAKAPDAVPTKDKSVPKKPEAVAEIETVAEETKDETVPKEPKAVPEIETVDKEPEAETEIVVEAPAVVAESETVAEEPEAKSETVPKPPKVAPTDTETGTAPTETEPEPAMIVDSDSSALQFVPVASLVETVETQVTTQTLVEDDTTTTITGTIVITRIVPISVVTQADLPSFFTAPTRVPQANSGAKVAVGALLVFPFLLV